MTQRYGIDTSVLVRLLTGLPEDEFERCDRELSAMVERRGVEILVSNQVIGEAYVAVQHHYGLTMSDARAGLLRLLRSRLVAPLSGRAVLQALESSGGPGLFDRLIVEGYSRAGLETLTFDHAMASLPGVHRL